MNAIAAERIDAGHGPEAGIAATEWKPIGRIGALFPDPLDDDADDDEVVDCGPVAASQWWASLSRDHQQRIADAAAGVPASEGPRRTRLRRHEH